MAADSFRFDETWEIAGATPAEVYNVLSHGELLPLWWKGVYLEAELSQPGRAPHVGARLRAKARGFLPYRLNFILEVTELVQDKLVAVKVTGDFDGRWRAALSPTKDGTHVDLTGSRRSRGRGRRRWHRCSARSSRGTTTGRRHAARRD